MPNVLRFFVFPAVLVSALISCAVPTDRPRLVLYVSIDQLRGDYFERYQSEFTGGFRRLVTAGVNFTNADLNYAASETGPGHATLGTGAYPATSGIVSNEWIDPRTRREVYCVEDSTAEPVEGYGGGFSARNLLVTGLGDWLKASSPKSKVFSLSPKDRGAILMGGKHPDGAFWYDRKAGRFVTSTYYTRRLPSYVRSLDVSEWIEKNVPPSWEKLMPESVYARYGPDEMGGEAKWQDDSSFPHPFDQENIKEQIRTSPYVDVLLLDLAREVINAEELGQRDVTDLLCISLSGCDYVGHAFGPNSHEVLDCLLRIDQALGAFLDDVERRVGKDAVLVVMSADHAVQMLPEYAKTIGNERSRRIIFRRDLQPKIAALAAASRKELGLLESPVQQNAFLNYEAAARVGIDSVTLEQSVKRSLLTIDGIEDVYFRRDMTSRENVSSYLDKYQRSYYAPRGKDFYVRFCEDCLITSSPTGSTHGSPYRYDTHVAMVFWGAGLQSKTVTREVHTVDVAPTIAKLLGITYPSTVDGIPLPEVTN